MRALEIGIHVLLVDWFLPGTHHLPEMHGIIQQQVEDSDEHYDLPADEPLTVAS